MNRTVNEIKLRVYLLYWYRFVRALLCAALVSCVMPQRDVYDAVTLGFYVDVDVSYTVYSCEIDFKRYFVTTMESV